MYILSISKQLFNKIENELDNHSIQLNKIREESVDLNVNPELEAGGHSSYGEASILYEFISYLRKTFGDEYLLLNLNYIQKTNQRCFYKILGRQEEENNTEKISFLDFENYLVKDEIDYIKRVVNTVIRELKNKNDVLNLKKFKEDMVKSHRKIKRYKIY